MSEKRVTVSLVQITQDTRPEGLMIHEVTLFRLPGFDYSQTCAALLDAEFKEFGTVQEAIDAKLAEGREEKRMSEKQVAVSLVQIQIEQDTRPGTIVHETTYFCLPGFDYSQTCEALRSAGFEWVNTVQEAIDAKLAEGRNE